MGMRLRRRHPKACDCEGLLLQRQLFRRCNWASAELVMAKVARRKRQLEAGLRSHLDPAMAAGRVAGRNLLAKCNCTRARCSSWLHAIIMASQATSFVFRLQSAAAVLGGTSPPIAVRGIILMLLLASGWTGLQLRSQLPHLTSTPLPQVSVPMFIPGCNCTKDVYPATQSSHTESNGSQTSTCDTFTYVRGPGQQVVSFSYFEVPESGYGAGSKYTKKSRPYLDGIELNLRLIRQFYPGWVMRLYFGNVQRLEPLCRLACTDPWIDICDVEHNPRLGNMSSLYPLSWRFVAVLDHQVDLVLSRDLDSIITAREVAAVREFLRSDRAFHIMRDHPAHNTYILGGTWAAKVHLSRVQFAQSFSAYFKDPLAYAPLKMGGGLDQVALQRFVYPWAKKVSMMHDSYSCKSYANTHPFPTRRDAGPNNFVGSVASLNSSISLTAGNECPLRCRPKEHPEWMFC